VSFLKKHLDGCIALALALATFAVLFLHSREMGSTRDESFYFDAAESYSGWFRELARNPGRALEDTVISRHFEINREHPVLFKNLMALSAILFAPNQAGHPWPQNDQGGYTAAMRLPGHLNAALLIALVYLFGTAVASRRVGLFAALGFLLVPRHFYNLHLACFDMPITTAWLATIMAYRKARTSSCWGVACGVFWGLALAIKHNAFFIPVVLVLHWLLVDWRSFSFSRQGIRFPRIPLSFFAMLILGPIVFFLHWPFLWHQTFERVGFWLGFHLHHINYYWEFFGTLLTDPPFPWGYAFAVTAVTLPLPTLLLCAMGFLGILGERLGRPLATLGRWLGRLAGLTTGPAPDRRPGLEPFDAWLLLLNGFFPVLLLSLPWVPIFGGVKHWLPAMPFLMVLAGIALDRVLSALPARWGRLRLTLDRRFAAVAALVLLPSLLGTLRVGAYGTIFYNELAGGVPGGADLGMQRQFWSNNVSGVLPWLNEHLPHNARLFLHECTVESFRTYQRDGYLRPDLRMAWSPDEADFVAYQYHREFVDAEYRIWNKVGQRKPLYGLYVDQVPLILVYDARPAGH
jgi:hypothetical protein